MVKSNELLTSSRFSGAVLLDEPASPVTPDAGDVAWQQRDGYLVGLNSSGEPVPLQAATTVAFVPGFLLDEVARNGWLAAYRTNGTRAAPTKIATGNRLMRIGAGGYAGVAGSGGAVVNDRATIDFETTAVNGNWDTTTDTPTRIMFRTTPDLSGTLTDAMGIYSDQSIYALRNTKRLDIDILYESHAGITTPSSTADQPILSQSIAANTLSNDGDRLLVHLEGDFLTNSGTPTFIPKIKWGAGTYVATGVAETASATPRHVIIDLEIIRTSATTQVIRGLWIHSNKASTVDLIPQATAQTWIITTDALTETLSGAITLQIVSNFSVANAANRMKSYSWSIRKLSV